MSYKIPFCLSVFCCLLSSFPLSQTNEVTDRTMSSFQVVDSSPGSSVSIMETSNFAHVIFQNVGKSFLPQAPLECRYTLTPYITPNPKDWVGIFKVIHIPLKLFSIFQSIISHHIWMISADIYRFELFPAITCYMGYMWGLLIGRKLEGGTLTRTSALTLLASLVTIFLKPHHELWCGLVAGGPAGGENIWCSLRTTLIPIRTSFLHLFAPFCLSIRLCFLLTAVRSFIKAIKSHT